MNVIFHGMPKTFDITHLNVQLTDLAVAAILQKKQLAFPK